MTTEVNGRIKLTWQQATAIVGFFLAIAAAWYDMREQVAGVRSEVASMRTELGVRVQKADADHVIFDRRIDRLEQRGRP